MRIRYLSTCLLIEARLTSKPTRLSGRNTLWGLRARSAGKQFAEASRDFPAATCDTRLQRRFADSQGLSSFCDGKLFDAAHSKGCTDPGRELADSGFDKYGQFAGGVHFFWVRLVQRFVKKRLRFIFQNFVQAYFDTK